MVFDTLDDDARYRAVESRDRRFDGVFFTGVRSTGIYCRPSCPAVTPKRANVDFYRTAAAAQRAGFRSCKRCAPDTSPGSPEWDRRGDTVGRAIQLIDDGVVDRGGVGGLARRLGYSSRHLHRLLVDELGAGTLELARAQRAHTARSLIDATDLSFGEIAFAAGFGSVRQFNDTIRDVYATTPSELRAQQRRGSPATGTVRVHLSARPPLAATELLSFLAARAIPGIEDGSARHYTRSLSLPYGHGIVSVRPSGDGSSGGGLCGFDAEFTLSDVRDLAPAVHRIRALLDLDADPIAIDHVLGSDQLLAPLVRRTPGLRAPGSVDVWEAIVRAIVGQQVSVAGARTVTGRLVARFGEPIADDLVRRHPTPDGEQGGVITHTFVEPVAWATTDLDDEAFAMPRSRSATLQATARAIVDGRIEPDADRSVLRRQLVAVKGIGPWTADYVLMRGRSDPNVFLATDLGVRHGLDRLIDSNRESRHPTDQEPLDQEPLDQEPLDQEPLDQAARWAPWCTYAVHHIWHWLSTASAVQGSDAEPSAPSNSGAGTYAH